MQTKNINIIAGVGIVLAVIFGVAYLKPTKVEVDNVVNVPRQEQATPSYGATPTLDGVDNPYVKINGLEYYYFSQPIMATSSVFCSLVNPFAPATTSVEALGTRITDGVTAASTFDIATGTGLYKRNASSSPAIVLAYNVGANERTEMTWFPRQSTTTDSNVNFPGIGRQLAIPDTLNAINPFILTSTSTLNWQIATGTPGTGDYYSGRCSALLRKI